MVLIYLFIIVIFYFLFKALLLVAYYNFTSRKLVTNKKGYIKFLISPVVVLKGEHKKDKYIKLYYYLSLLLSLSWAVLLCVNLERFIDLFRINSTITLLYLISVGFTIIFLLYLSIFDLISFSIPALTAKRLLLFVALVNLIFLVLRIINVNQEYGYIFNLINLGTITNLLGGLLGGGIIWVIVKLSGEKAMGSGDVDILAAVGLFLGFPLVFSSFFYTLISASIVSIVYVLLKRKYKGVMIPFVPFLATGFVCALVFSDSLIRFFQLY